jgi:hypothetical protein
MRIFKISKSKSKSKQKYIGNFTLFSVYNYVNTNIHSSSNMNILHRRKIKIKQFAQSKFAFSTIPDLD